MWLYSSTECTDSPVYAASLATENFSSEASSPMYWWERATLLPGTCIANHAPGFNASNHWVIISRWLGIHWNIALEMMRSVSAGGVHDAASCWANETLAHASSSRFSTSCWASLIISAEAS